MEERVELLEECLDATEWYGQILSTQKTHEYGVVASFCSIVRPEDFSPSQTSHPSILKAIEYETPRELFRSETSRIIAEIRTKHPNALGPIWVIHRVGIVPIGHPITAMFVAGRHRAEAFDALEMLAKEVRLRVVLWKKLHLSDGTAFLINSHEQGAS